MFPIKKILVMALGFSGPVCAQENFAASTVTSESRSEVVGGSELYSLDSGKARLQGFGLNSGMNVGFSRSFAGGFTVRQAYSPQDNFASLYTGFEVKVSYAVLGSFINRSKVVNQGEWTVMKAGDIRRIRLAVDLHSSTLFLSTKQASIPFSGLGMGFTFDLPVFTSARIGIGAAVDRVTNGDTPMTLTKGLGIVSYTL